MPEASTCHTVKPADITAMARFLADGVKLKLLTVPEGCNSAKLQGQQDIQIEKLHWKATVNLTAAQM